MVLQVMLVLQEQANQVEQVVVQVLLVLQELLDNQD